MQVGEERRLDGEADGVGRVERGTAVAAVVHLRASGGRIPSTPVVGVGGCWVGCYTRRYDLRLFSLFNTYRMIWCFAGNTTRTVSAAIRQPLGVRG